jgi:acetyl esterase/lipase
VHFDGANPENTVFLPEYRLVPEYPFPAAIQDAQKAYRWLLTQGYKPNNIFIAGDSAGGGLSVATVLALREAGDALPAAVVCLSPWADLTCSGQSHAQQAEAESMLNTATLQKWATYYAGSDTLKNPLISPVYADFHNFPPLLIQVGSDEILLDDARALAEKAKAAGAQVELKIWNGMWHVWHIFGELIPESRQAFEEIGQFIETVIAKERSD